MNIAWTLLGAALVAVGVLSASYENVQEAFEIFEKESRR